MYMELVRRVIEEAVEIYARNARQTVPAVLALIRDHIDRTAQQHFTDEPNIDYDDPLCRLGYLYRHAPAGAGLFERVLQESGEVRQKIRGANRATLDVCAVGGGPGTELLGLAKYLLGCWQRGLPRRIEFTVLDKVPHWAETWRPLSNAVEEELRTSLGGHGVEPPTIFPMFLPMDVLDPASYRGYAFQFGKADVVVFNYLFSENKGRLGQARSAVEYLAQATPTGCVFVVIDRLEADQRFKNDVFELFEAVFGNGIPVRTHDGTLDQDEQTSDMGEMLTEMLLRPRVSFHTDLLRKPTVFWFTIVRQ